MDTWEEYNLITEPSDEYHAKSGKYLSSGLLKKFMACPLLYYQTIMGWLPQKDSAAYKVGRAVHTCVLEGFGEYRLKYAAGGPINEKTGRPFGHETKAFKEWAASQDAEILTDAEAAVVDSCGEGVSRNACAENLLTSGVPEAVVRAELHGIECQIRMDWFSPVNGLVDLKTCGDLTWFEADARRYNYINQIAFYLDVLKAHTGKMYPAHIIAVEKQDPYRCGVWHISETVLSVARQQNREAMSKMLECKESDVWPTGYEDVRDFDFI